MGKILYRSVLKNTLKRFSIIFMCFIQVNNIHSQSPNDLTREINRKLKVLSSPSAEVPGGYIFNNSYEGMKGGPFLFDKFVTLNIMVKEVDYYIPVEANIDLRNSALLYKDPETGQFYSIPPDRVLEFIAVYENDTLVFKTTENKRFNSDINEIRFIQVLKEGSNSFVKIPYKIFIPADYTGAYTAKRRYDEYRTEYRYFVMTPDDVYKEVKLTKNSLVKAFPEKKDMIKQAFRINQASDKEQIALSLLGNL